MDLSICLVNYNAKDLSLQCLQSIYDRTQGISFEIIFVDNDSHDGSVEAVQDTFPEVKVIKNSKNIGFAKANNQAFDSATGEFILLLNNDTVILNNALANLVKFMRANHKIGVCACKIFEADGQTIQRNCRSFPSPIDTVFGRASLLTKILPKNPRSKRNLLSDWDYNSIRTVDWVSGAFFLTRREIIQKIGGLDGNFFMFWEDTDFCYRVRQAGWQVVYNPAGEIIHFSGQGGGHRSFFLKLVMIVQMHWSAYYFFLKHYYKNSFNPFAIFVFLGMIGLISLKIIIESFKHLKKICYN